METKQKQWEEKVVRLSAYNWFILCTAYLKKNRLDLVKLGNALRQDKSDERLYHMAAQILGEHSKVGDVRD